VLVQTKSLHFPHHFPSTICHKKDEVGVCFPLHLLLLFLLKSRPTFPCLSPSQKWPSWSFVSPLCHQNLGLHACPLVQLQWGLICLVLSYLIYPLSIIAHLPQWYDPKGEIYGVKCIRYDPKLGINGVKFICNDINIYVLVASLMKGPHVQCVSRYI